MSQTVEPAVKIWTAAELAARFGPVPMNRIRTDPPPGMGTVEDVVDLDNHEDRLYELIDGVLLEKDMGAYESYLAVQIAKLLATFVDDRKLGIVLGEGGMLRLFPGRVRIPDVCFISFDRKPFEAMGDGGIADVQPDLAVEVISKGNTREEMNEKLKDYFDNGTRLVWYVYPKRRSVDVYTSQESFSTVTKEETLDGGDVLPGFEWKLSELFARPQQGGK